jgi:hypothetical protein
MNKVALSCKLSEMNDVYAQAIYNHLQECEGNLNNEDDFDWFID